MKDETGIALYRKAGELSCPVGVMCFKGFRRHVEEIKALLASSPQTKVCYSMYCWAVWCRLGTSMTTMAVRGICSLPL